MFCRVGVGSVELSSIKVEGGPYKCYSGLLVSLDFLCKIYYESRSIEFFRAAVTQSKHGPLYALCAGPLVGVHEDKSASSLFVHSAVHKINKIPRAVAQ